MLSVQEPTRDKNRNKKGKGQLLCRKTGACDVEVNILHTEDNRYACV